MPINQTVKFIQKIDFFNPSSQESEKTLTFSRPPKLPTTELIRKLCKSNDITTPTKFTIKTRTASVLENFNEHDFVADRAQKFEFIYDTDCLKVLKGNDCNSILQVLYFDPKRDIFDQESNLDVAWWMNTIEVIAEPLSVQKKTFVSVRYPDGSNFMILVTPMMRGMDIADAVSAHMELEKHRLLKLLQENGLPAPVLQPVSQAQNHVVVTTDAGLQVNRVWNIAIDTSSDSVTLGDLKRAIAAVTGVPTIYMQLKVNGRIVESFGFATRSSLKSQHIEDGSHITLDFVPNSKCSLH